ncbi:MAG: hypothetical protein IPJ68_02850 [Candidatus Moraniibacteriota bacterium]|nr:MAG: hypothetical protein IPJ68_02850 [Candidatus Moranbacteria bacterium]
MNEVWASPLFHTAVFLGISVFLGFVYVLQPVKTATLCGWCAVYAVQRHSVVGAIIPPPQFVRYYEGIVWRVWGWFLVPLLVNMGLWSLFPPEERFLNIWWFLILGAEVWLGLWLRRQRRVRLTSDWLRYEQLTEAANRVLEGRITDQTAPFERTYYGRQITFKVIADGRIVWTHRLFVYSESDADYAVRYFGSDQLVRIIYRPRETRDDDGSLIDELPEAVSGVILRVEALAQSQPVSPDAEAARL